jgi:hypothetical protein
MKKSPIFLSIIVNTLLTISHSFASEQDQINKVMSQCIQLPTLKICQALQIHKKENYSDSDINSIKTVMKSFCPDLNPIDKNSIIKCFQTSKTNKF